MIFKKLSKIIMVSLSILLASPAISSVQGTSAEITRQMGYLGGYALLTGGSIFLGTGSLYTLFSLYNPEEELEYPEQRLGIKNLSYAGLICAAWGLYTGIIGMQQADANLYEAFRYKKVTNSCSPQSALDTLNLIHVTLAKSKI